MNRRNRVLVLLLLGLAFPVPAHAMIELLPAFFAVTGLLVMVTVVPVALLLKRIFIHRRFGQMAVISWKRLCIVTCAEAMIMTFSLLVSFTSMQSMFVPRYTGGPDIAAILAVFASATVLYSILAVMPNMWLLSRMAAHPDARNASSGHPAFAWLLSLPLPCALILLVMTLFASVS